MRMTDADAILVLFTDTLKNVDIDTISVDGDHLVWPCGGTIC